MTTVLWQASDGGSEICVLEPVDVGWRLRGTVLTHEDGRPIEIRYTVTADSGWATTDVDVRVTVAGGDPGAVPGIGALWSATDRPAPFTGCVDVDLGFTPATNTLPIRRLGLEVGDEAEIEAAWLTWPELELRPARQRYARLDRYRYRYTQDDFVAELAVTDEGLVTHYEGLWRAVART